MEQGGATSVICAALIEQVYQKKQKEHILPSACIESDVTTQAFLEARNN